MKCLLFSDCCARDLFLRDLFLRKMASPALLNKQDTHDLAESYAYLAEKSARNTMLPKMPETRMQGPKQANFG